MRDIVHLACEECGRRNYHTTKNKKTHPEKFEIRKYCKFCKKHTKHKEAKL
ncbi:50S ribosomal protein L33 [Nitratiruptor sp. SB155-2]|uniref:50S ribosomal protein L33 n=1 Tax=Nitratiruptor sp. (strain SB155-2) TaxID=387092 RepID=UPI0001586D74|nr:50S ribosomal protein L33 [Nitratiruptor sp. SB155-2]BAF69375.1 50S ribosomal protein L33 [Nitratiruptor sp. SB155-2]